MNTLKNTVNKYRYQIQKGINELVFPYSEHGRNIKKLRNIHLHKRCFIIGNGPSLRSEDLDELKNEITFAFNRIYYMFNQTDWRPTYYCSEDDKTIFKSKNEINELQLANKFFPINFPRDYNVHFNNANYFIFKMGNKSSEPNFSNDIVKGIYWGNTVAYTAIQMAVYMGIKEIYLLGVDHSFSKVVNDQGEVIVDKTLRDYFSEEYNKDKDDLYIPNVDVSTRAFEAARKYADQNNIKIYNATRGGKLDVFERVDFSKIIAKKARFIV